jgi:outer membrane protein assembly factor BamB
LVFATDCAGVIHCVDVNTGKPYWTHQATGDIWASPMIADGKLYVGTRKGEFVVLAAGKEKNVLSTINIGDPISGTATAANGTLYVATMTHLYAIGTTGVQ